MSLEKWADICRAEKYYFIIRDNVLELNDHEDAMIMSWLMADW